MKRKNILEMKNISKRYGGIEALKDVDLNLYEGELLCLLGENGAGKSTLMKILSGVEHQSRGDIFLQGKKVDIKHPQDAHELGISTVYQELVQFPDMTIMENIYVGRYPKSCGFVDFSTLEKKTLALMEKLDIKFNPRAYIRDLSVAQRQLVEIMKAVSFNSKIIIFDEPTSSLTQDETEILFRIIKNLQREGTSIIYISHRLEDIFAIGDRITILRDGENSGGGMVSEITQDEVISMMVGRVMEEQFPELIKNIGKEVLRVENISNENVENASFSIRQGEILGFGGLVGAGRTELMRAIMGLDKSTGSIYKEGEKIENSNPTKAIKNGFALVPEDRKEQGLVLIRNITHNIEMSSLKQLSKFGFMQTGLERMKTLAYIKRLNIKTSGPEQIAGNLSGGNQQKVVLGKGLATMPEILILDEPTRGIDVGSKAEIYQIMNELISQGVAIIMISSELPELINMSHRIVVMREGKITGEISAEGVKEEDVMSLAVKEVVPE